MAYEEWMRRTALVGVALATVGCGAAAQDAGTTEPPTDLPAEITCETQYRPDAERPTGEERATLTVPRREDPLGAEEEVEFATMALLVTYTGEAPEGRTMSASVTGGDGEQLARHLYQFGEPQPQDITFAGGHGFTGLAYLSHDGAQLQYWCEAHADAG
jgi:hypothetical protein